MKFGDVVMAVATAAVILVLITFLLDWVLISTIGYFWGMNVGFIVSIFLATLITGYLFAAHIWEARMKAIAKITILTAVLIMFTVMIEVAALGPYWAAWVQETYLDANPGANPSTFDWYAIAGTYLGSQVVLNMVIALVLGFIGLYIGSMFKRPTRS